MKSFINGMSRFCLKKSLGLLFIRVALGILFFAHGWAKIHNIGGTETMFAHMGFPMWVGLFIAWLEAVGGIALILGVLTRVFGVMFGIEMLVAVFIGNWSRALGGTELLLSLASFGIALAGSGRYSLYSMECDNCGGMLCKPGEGDCTGKP